MPISEDHPQNPVNPYGETKLAVEKMLHWYGRAYGLRYAALRYFNAAGADPDGEVGEDHDPETHLIPLAIDAAMGGKALEIYGTDYGTTDGTAIRDYIHVLDLADAHVAALAKLRAGATSLCVNLGTGRGHSVREVIAAVEKVSGKKIAVRETGRRAGNPPALVADARLAADVLGWKPRIPSIETIVEHAWRWTQKRSARDDGSERAGAARELGAAVASAARGVGDRGGAPAAAAVDGQDCGGGRGASSRPTMPAATSARGTPRVAGAVNARYGGTFVFDNDHPCVGPDAPRDVAVPPSSYRASPAVGAARVVCFSPRHDLTLAEMPPVGDRRGRRPLARPDARAGRAPGGSPGVVLREQGRRRRRLQSAPARPDLRDVVRVEDVRDRARRVGAPPARHRPRADGGHHARRAAGRPPRAARGRARDRVRALLRPLRLRGLRRPQAARGARVRSRPRPRCAALAGAISAVTVRFDNLWRMSFPYVQVLHQAPTDGGDYKAFHFFIGFIRRCASRPCSSSWPGPRLAAATSFPTRHPKRRPRSCARCRPSTTSAHDRTP